MGRINSLLTLLSAAHAPALPCVYEANGGECCGRPLLKHCQRLPFHNAAIRGCIVFVEAGGRGG